MRKYIITFICLIVSACASMPTVFAENETEISASVAEQTISSQEYGIEPYNLGPPVSDTWTQISSMTERRANTKLVMINNDLYAIGGNGAGGYSFNIEKYNGSSWQQVTALYANVKGFAVTVDESRGTIYIIGGCEGTGLTTNDYSNKVYAYNISQNQWTPLEPMTEKRDQPVAVYNNDKLYVFGGRNHIGFVNSYEVYDFTSQTWTKTASGFDAELIRYGATAKYIDGDLYIYNGIGVDYDNKGVMRYDLDNLTVGTTVLTGDYDNISTAWGMQKALIFAEKAGTSDCDVFELNYSDEKLSAVSIVPCPARGRYSQYVLYGGYLYCVGGYNTSSKQYLNTVSKYSVNYGSLTPGDGTVDDKSTPDGNEITLNVEAGHEYTIFINLKNTDLSSKDYTFTIEYPDNSFTIEDACAMTGAKETTTGYVPGSNVTVTECASNGLSFTYEETTTTGIAAGKRITKTVNAVRLKANSSGERTIKYSMT